MKARFAEEIGTRAFLRLYWGELECPNCVGRGSRGYHTAKVLIAASNLLEDWTLAGTESDYALDPRWPHKCDHCEATAPADAKRQIFRQRLYSTPTGELEPGCLYWDRDWQDDVTKRCRLHDDCDGVHLCAVLPNHQFWDIDSRCSNCTRKEDRTHRCWVRHGTPPEITVDKNGDTCAAGGGSVIAGSYHGFLRNGVFVNA